MNFIYVKIKENMPIIKRYAISSFITFFTGFVLAIAAQIDTLTIQSFESGAAVGLLITALRAGFKLLIEAAVKKLTQKKYEASR